jgi:hypothetical protein
MTFASVLVLVLEVYAATGVAVALVFLTVGVGRVDEAASHSYAFRVLLVPGVILLWPLVLIRWSQLSRRPDGQHRNSHAT